MPIFTKITNSKQQNVQTSQAEFHETHQYWKTLSADFLRQISPTLDNKFGIYGHKSNDGPCKSVALTATI
jgi:hypothetical protein